MAVTYTTDQQKVIDLRDCNILVSAAAGSGKTAVLTERILQRVCDPHNPIQIDRMLIVTFTNAAAAEMRERIGNAMRKRLEEEPSNKHLRRQITLLNNAQITTIDSFCLYLLRNHFHEIQLDPGFRVADEGEIKLLKAEVLENYLESKYEEGKEAFLDLIEKYAGSGNESSLEELILRLYTFSQSQPFPEVYLKEAIAVLEKEGKELSEECLLYLQEYENNLIKECISYTDEAIRICNLEGGPCFYAEALKSDLDYYQRLTQAQSLSERAALYTGYKYVALSRKTPEYLVEEYQAEVKNLRETCKKIVQDIKKRFYYASMEVMQEDNEKANRTLAELLRLTLEFSEVFEQEKRRKNMIDFSDMEHLALRILFQKEGDVYVPGEVALSYRDYFEEIMVDEYQDSNQVQELLLESISRQTEAFGNRFMVGDVKQSIYRFRLARPEIFMEKYASYDADTGKNRRIDLSQNFRSRSEVLEGVNAVFEKLMTPAVGKISYDDAARLYPGAKYPEASENETEILLYDRKAFEEEDLSAVEAEGHIIAQRIRDLCRDFLVTDKKTGLLRPAKYSDMVILLRTAAGVDDVLKKVLEEEGIPTYISSGKGYFAAPEIRTVLNYITIMNNPRQDIPLLGVLHSFIGGFEEEEIAKIRIANHKEGRLYDSLVYYGEYGGDNSLRRKVEQFLSKVNAWRRKTSYLSVYELLEDVIDKTGLLQYCMAMPGGTQRRANLLVLLQKAKTFEKSGYSGLFDFIRYIELMKEKEVDFGEANVLDEGADVVRIMTIHKSKGLEFPICFVAGFSKQFNIRETADAVLADADLGLGSDCIDLRLRCKRKSLRKNIIAVKQKLDGRGEDLRILYVALTRAKEKLILVGHGDASSIKHYGYGVHGLLKAKSFMELVLPIAKEREDLFKIYHFMPEDMLLEEVSERAEAAVLRRHLADVAQEKVWEPYVYPHVSLEGLYTKTTVSELKKAAYLEEEEHCNELYREEEIVPYVPDFIAHADKEAGGARRGSAYHRVMELMDFTLAMHKETMEDAVKALRKQAVDDLRISASDDALVSSEKVLKFMNSQLAHRMALAEENGKLYKEQPFMMRVDANTVSSDFPEEEDILVQGVIDVYFEEDDELVLMDYKTDHVFDSEELIKRYKTQLEYYAKALEKLTHKRVKEKLIYSFALHRVISVE